MATKRNEVERFDFQRIDAARVTLTPQGFLRVSGNLTRIGVLDYYRADGSRFRELRLPDEVFRSDSLDTIKLAPVTDLHSAMVSPANVDKLQIGVVGEDVGHDDRFVTGSALIQRQDAIDAVRSKRRCELSPGYRCYVEPTAGEWNGQKYDGIQRAIVYNHLAIGPKNWGRAGPEVALRLDGLSTGAAVARLDNFELGAFLRDRFSLLNMSEAEIANRLDMETIELGILLDGFSLPDDKRFDKIAGLIDVDVDTLKGFIPAAEKGDRLIDRRQDGPPAPSISKGIPMKKIQIVLDGVAYEVEIAEPLAANFEAAHKKLQTKADNADKLEADLVVERKKSEGLQTKLDEANDPAKLQAAVTARAELTANVRKLAPELEVDEKLDDKGLKIAALVAAGYEKETFDGRDEAFVDGVFVAALKAKPEDKTDDKGKGTRSAGPAPKPKTRTDGDEIDKYDAAAARARMVERNRSMSEGKLDYSRD